MEKEPLSKANGKQRENPDKTVILLDDSLRATNGFTQIPNAVLRHPNLVTGSKVAYGLLLSYAWRDDFTFPAQETLAKDCACSVRQIQRFLNELKKIGAISWKQLGLNRPNRYFIHPITDWIRDNSLKNKDTTPVSHPDTTDSLDTTYMSHPDMTPASGQDRTPVSHYEDSEKNTQSNVNVRTSKTQNEESEATSQTGSEVAGYPYSPTDFERMVYSLRERLQDRGESDFNIRQIVKCLPKHVIETAYFEAWGKYRDDKTSKPAGYFVGICKNKAIERGIDLGFRKGENRPQPKAGYRDSVRTSSRQGRGMEKIGDVLADTEPPAFPEI